MAELRDILDFINAELDLEAFSDASLNGLQVEGSAEVSLIATAVDAGLSVIEDAVSIGAQMLLVHHGLFWGKPFAIAGAKKRVIETLLNNSLSLVAIHLPLDAHSKHGNNAALADLLKLESRSPAVLYQGMHIGCCGVNRAGLLRDDIRSQLASLPGANPDFLELPFGPKKPERICIASGSAADQLYAFESENFDTLITGEPKQFAYHFCKENKLNAFFVGHYASETLGVQRLAKEICQRFSTDTKFIDEPTGI